MKQGSALSTQKNVGGMTIKVYLLLSILSGLIVTTIIVAFLLLRYVPNIINSQIELRNEAITVAFAQSIKKPAMLKNYLRVNKETRMISGLPGVAYAAVINERGVAMAGFFSDLKRFDRGFARLISEKGFTPDIFAASDSAKSTDGKGMLHLGGQDIYDRALKIPDANVEVHVGIYVSEVKNAIHSALFSPLSIILFCVIILLGSLTVYFLNRAITQPIEELTNCVDKISKGDMELEIFPQGPKEFQELALSFSRMQQSFRYIIEKMR